MIEDEHTNQWAWHLSNAIGGVKLKVLDQDAIKAYEIINEKPIDQTHCPNCNSTEIYFDQVQKPISIFLSIFLFLFPFPVYKNKWTCQKCHHVWKRI